MVTSLIRVRNPPGGIRAWTPEFPNPVSPLILLPDDDRGEVTDYVQIVERSPRRLRLTRPGFEDYRNCTPGARYRFQTNATQITIAASSSNTVDRSDARNYFAYVLVNGVATYSFDTRDGGMVINLGSAVSRLFEIVWPYADAMDLHSITINAGGSFTTPAARPAAKIACAGDSITQGFTATSVIATWAFKLAVAKSRQLLNLGDGGDAATASYANALIGTGADRVTYMIGYNNFAAQTPLANFQSQVEGWITNAKAALPSAKIYVISPVYSPNSGPITLAQYRTAVQAAVAAVGGANVTYINGLSIMTNSNGLLVDGVHPNDSGSTEIANNLNSLIAA